MSDCFICKKPLGNINVRTVKAKGVKTLLDRAKAKNNLDNEQFLQTVSEISVHIACYQYYSDSRTDNAVRRLSSSSSSSAVSELVETDFDFVHNCFICGEAFQDESHLRQNRQRRICEVRNEGTKKSIMDLIHKRADHEVKVIADRIANVPCLVNVKARYHNDCSKQLYSKKWWDKKKSHVRKNDIDNAMEYVFTYLNENSEECQFLLADLMQSIKGDYTPERRTIVERLKVKYEVCLHCGGESCSNIVDMSTLLEENELEDELPTMTPIPTPIILQKFTSDTDSDFFSQPGPSKRMKK